MKERETFLERWSRRKRASAQAEPEAGDVPAEQTPTAAAPSSCAPPAAEPTEPPFDLSKLPPLESITGETDIRAYLAPGVPAELTRAALRRAWTADPKIRDFVGLSENSWDFNAPEGVSGFGRLNMTDEMRRQIANMVGRAIADEPERESLKTPGSTENSTVARENLPSSAQAEAAAPQEAEQGERPAPPKRHGRALPA
jgi:hypothetical protein